MNAVVMLALGWLLILVVFLSFLALLRYLDHRERMAMILRGITPPDKRGNRLSRPALVRRAGVLQGGLITAMVGLALTVGLYPLGYILPPSLAAPYHLGPWLLAGLIPLAVGIALIIGHYLTPGRPLSLSTPENAKEAAGSRADEASPQEQGQQLPARAELLALPDARRRSLYQLQSSGSAQPALEPEDADEEG